MKVMLLVMDEQRVILDWLYESIKNSCESCTIFRLSGRQQRNLGHFLSSVDFRAYDRVVIFTRVKRQITQLAVLKCIPGLVFFEHDAYQNYMVGSKYFGAYSDLYLKLPWARALVSGCGVARQLRDEGVDAVFVSKGYDEHMLRNLERPRDIDVGFLGSLVSGEYSGRKAILEEIASRTHLHVARTRSGQEYLETLNRIRIFVSADVGMGEYMIKNFEAMACGCVLLAYSQGAEEDAAIGFEDGRNVMLYRSADEAVERIERLLAEPALADQIARAGQIFVEQRYTFARVGHDLAKAIEQPMRPWPGVPGWLRLWVRLRYGLKVGGLLRPASLR